MDDKELIDKGYKRLPDCTYAWINKNAEVYMQARKVNCNTKKAYFLQWSKSPYNSERVHITNDKGVQKSYYKHMLLYQLFGIKLNTRYEVGDISKYIKKSTQKPWKERLLDITEKFKGKGGCSLNMGKSFADYLS